jgi:hypothetical protein
MYVSSYKCVCTDTQEIILERLYNSLRVINIPIYSPQSEPAIYMCSIYV